MTRGSPARFGFFRAATTAWLSATLSLTEVCAMAVRRMGVAEWLLLAALALEFMAAGLLKVFPGLGG